MHKQKVWGNRVKKLLTLLLLFMSISSAGCLQKAAEKIKTPEANLNVKIDGISENNLQMTVEAEIINPNPISIDVGDIKVTIKGEKGVIKETIIRGGTIPGNGKKTFTSKIGVPLNIITEKTVVIDIKTEVGAAGINVKLPVRARTTIQFQLENMIKSPKVNLVVKPELSDFNLELLIQSKVTNPNPVGIEIDDLQILMKKENGYILQKTVMPGGLIPENGEKTFSAKISIPLNIITERTIIIEAKSKAGIAGVNIKLPIESTTKIVLPDLESMIRPPRITEDILPSKLRASDFLPRNPPDRSVVEKSVCDVADSVCVEEYITLGIPPKKGGLMVLVADDAADILENIPESRVVVYVDGHVGYYLESGVVVLPKVGGYGLTITGPTLHQYIWRIDSVVFLVVANDREFAESIINALGYRLSYAYGGGYSSGYGGGYGGYALSYGGL